MFKLLVILTILISNLNATSLKNLSYQQKEVLSYVYSKAKEFNLSLTMTAIAWQESQFGRYELSLSDPSCGIFHVMPAILAVKVGLQNDSWNRSRLCEKLITDRDFSFSAALLELKYWQNYWEAEHVSRVWSHMVASYNGGFNINIKTNIYLKNIKAKIRLLKKYLKEKNENKNINQ